MIAHIDRLGFIVPKANTLYIPEDWVGYVSTENQQLNIIYFKIHSEFFLASLHINSRRIPGKKQSF